VIWEAGNLAPASERDSPYTATKIVRVMDRLWEQQRS
jgi:hypothetical protein